MPKWIVLDRDGVINHDDDAYIKRPEEWQPLAGSLEAMAALNNAGYHIAVATNQSGLGRGLFDEQTLAAIHHKMQKALSEKGGHIAGIFYCPHKPEDQCHCRKPAIGLLDQIEAHFGISLAGVPFVGDSLKDIQAARSKHCEPILVLTGKGKLTQQKLRDREEFADVPVYPDLATFASRLLAKKEITHR